MPHDVAPALHVSSFEAGGVAGFLAQAAAVAPGIEALLARACVEGAGTILEGVHLVPGSLPRQPPRGESGTLVPLLLVVDEAEVHRSYLVTRSRGSANRPPQRYLDRFEEIRHIQAELVRRAEAHDIPVVRSTSLERTVADATAIVEKALTDV